MDISVNMRLLNKDILLLPNKSRNNLPFRQWKGRLSSVFVLAALTLTACGGPSIPLGKVGNVTGDLGGVASDEPRATLVAEDILSSGGTAADAAAALYFTLAVTYPVAASVGGGGECIVYSTETNKLENLQFQNKAPAAGGAIAIPGNIRGMAALQARYGRLDWTTLLSPAEKLANFGEPISRAQHMAMILNKEQLNLDFDLNRTFKDKEGKFVAEGTRIRQVQLAGLLSALRSEGGASFYSGNWARTFIEDANNAGGRVTLQDIVNYKPIWVDARTFRVDDNMAGVSADTYGEPYARLWGSLFSEGKSILRTKKDIPITEIADATASVFTDFNTASPFISNGTTSFVTTDKEGNAVACVVGLKKPFGSGNIGAITGIVLAPNIPVEQSEFLTSPMLVVNLPNKDFYYGSAATGGAAGTPASVAMGIDIFGNDSSLDSAMNASRLFTMGKLLPLLYETSMPDEEVAAINKEFPVLVEVDRLAVVNAIYCRNGKTFNCVSRHDPRGFGLSLIEN